MTTREEIGKRIQKARKAKKYTQKKLSELTRINKTTISRIENGWFTGSFDIFERILDEVDLQFEIAPKKHILPHWDDIEKLFKDK
ncbi:TPA: helix-turn-helix transcriptional regulator [Acinetobacter baumannii]|uniref:helix-turn-helix domain-containing protein n=1 Tax=Acinetobacter baumannii TaxID=470 RepID=UPI001FD67ED8|nr:helix-turn-helix transcriptional regulator [Acinetobacter baumannii]MDC5063921.1 helix-turn-helix domain-containing protein [Acinetobacter baumannii]HCH8075557.1 helix-turn-helix transcriptional regulator [Acinetobacter baumannii]HDF7033802.1 helix-turn-helix transcriptional regulator [Acinetobacter baumannii]